MAAALLAVLAAALFLGKGAIDLDQQNLQSMLETVRSSAWSYPAVVLLFVSLALIGFPQALLFAATTAVFGPWVGIAYAWSATLASGFVTFTLGRWFGQPLVTKISARRLQELLSLMRRRGLVASMLVRWVPSGPFIVVNMLCGTAGMPVWKFLAGLGIGALPKLAIIAFFTDQASEIVSLLRQGDLRAIGLVLVMAGMWIGLIWLLRDIGVRMRRSASGPRPSDLTNIPGNETVKANGEPVLNLKSKAR
jgi:uncharacterized membrane protein YdjX (TVP38/TMEM64 family)